MAKLTRTDISEVIALARRMRCAVEAGSNPLPLSLDTTLLGAKVRMSPEGLSLPFDFRRVRATMSARSGLVTIGPLPLQPDGYGPVMSEPDEFEAWLAAALAHEACHVLQHRDAPANWDEGGSALVAAELGERAIRTKDYACYLSYVGHPLELEAHATQMAAEVLIAHGRGLNASAFASAAMQTCIAGHIAEHPDLDPDTRRASAARIKSTVELVIGAAWLAYEHFR